MKTGAQVLVFPAWRFNPYLNLLSLSARAAGYDFVSSTEFTDFVTRLKLLRRGDTVHVHWTSPIAQDASSERSAVKRVALLRRALASACRRGVRLVWTVHNRLPHEMRYREQEIELFRLLAARADAIHVMTEDTRAVLADVCELPVEKIRRIPHPNYQGIYETGISRHDARAAFDLEEDDIAVLFLGQIRPYKGIDALLQAIEKTKASMGRRLVLLLAGAVNPDDLAALEESLPRSVRTVAYLDFVPDEEIALWFRAADVAVFPYRQILNSGSVHLAATFGVPVIIPDEPHLRKQYLGQEWVRYFDPADPVVSLAAKLSEAATLSSIPGSAFAEFVERLSPWRISIQYRSLLDSLSPQV